MANVMVCQRMSVLPKTRQLQSAEGRQWSITGSTTFDDEYQGQSARVEALISPSLEDKIFLGWMTLRNLMSGPIYGNQFPTPDAKVRRKNNIEPKSLHNHVNTTRLAGTPRLRHEYNTLNKPCPGCGEDKLLRYRKNCPNKNKICYNCGRLGHIREVCRTMTYQITGRNDCQRTEPWPADIKWDIEFPLPTSEFRGMSQYPYLPIRSLGKLGTPAEHHKKWIND